MINIQIRGFLSKIEIQPISESEKNFLLNFIGDSKMTLSEILLDKNKFNLNSSKELMFPIVTDDAEIIITSFAENDYYSDGYAFFREKVNNMTDKASTLENLALKDYGIIKEKIYYGCSFESNVKEVNYKNFDKNNVDIETVSIPFMKTNYINNVFFCNQKIHDVIKSKNQFIKHKAVLYENSYKSNSNLNNSEFNIITYSEHGNG
tara:strand:+ start:2562 stop:3179 length:618 start_codon:yes stop_codon:yes gene_type:complete